MGRLTAHGASRTWETLREKLRDSRGCGHSWNARGFRYFLALSNRESEDLSLTGVVEREVIGSRKADGSFKVTTVGSFRIEPDGQITRGPRAMRAAVNQLGKREVIFVGGARFFRRQPDQTNWFEELYS